MSFSNLDYLYASLPARYRREDKDLFLKRFLQFFGTTLDDWDAQFEAFHANVNPETAPENFLDFWLDRLFGWSWFPAHFTLRQKRALYANFAGHLARRGTRRGIELWLRDFGAIAAIWLREDFLGETYLGEGGYTVSQPLLVVVEIIALLDWNSQDQGTLDDCFLGESSFVGEPPARLNDLEIERLLRFSQPIGQAIVVADRRYDAARQVSSQMRTARQQQDMPAT